MTAPAADHRPDAYEEAGGLVVYRASALGGCIRALVAARQGYTPVSPDEKSLRVMGEGVLHEDHILASLERSKGWEVGRRQEELELRIGTRLVVRCHPDGVATGGALEAGGRVIEVKAMGRDVYTRWLKEGWGGFRRYAWQMSIEMFVTGRLGIFAVKNRDTGEITVEMVDDPPVGLAEIKARVVKAEAAAARGELPACDPVSWLCSYRYLHEETGGNGDAARAVEDVEVDALAGSYDVARARATQAEAMQKEARARLIEALGERDKVHTTAWKVSRSTQKRSRLDKDKAAADGVDLSAYEVASETVTLRVTAVGEP